jgi:uncharacterized membrane protein YgcG
VAEFPNSDLKHGILRAIPRVYDGHTVNLLINSVTDQNDQLLNYTTSEQNDNLILKIGDADKFVRGQQTYYINYQLSDVTKAFDDHDEFFWDTNGTQGGHQFNQVTARIHLPAEIATNFNEQTRCLTGIERSIQAECKVRINTGQTEMVVTVTSNRSLSAGENMSVVLGFEPDTFEPYKMDPQQLAALLALAIASLAIPGAAFLIMWRKWRSHGRDPKGRGIIIPEYAPPAGMNPVLADMVLNEQLSTKAISATALGLCVKKYLKLYEVKKDKLIGSKIEYELELTKDTKGLSAEEKKVIDILLGSGASVRDKVNLSEQKNKLYTQVDSLKKSANKAVSRHGYFTASPTAARKQYIGWGIILLIVGFIVMFPAQLIFLGAGAIAAGIIVLVFSGAMPARTELGVATKEHLLGLKDYMKLAEADRIRILQSPKGSEKSLETESSDEMRKKALSSRRELVSLYEKLLPYAMLFGIEKEWAKEFADLYEQPPDWYSGSRTFNTGVFAGAISGFNTASTSSFAAPSSSSSSGFSSGGGSGGGGGGGGVGSW